MLHYKDLKIGKLYLVKRLVSLDKLKESQFVIFLGIGEEQKEHVLMRFLKGNGEVVTIDWEKRPDCFPDIGRWFEEAC